ncbi:hypothetical protein [Microbulbifer rhizosphaerae]|uniref:Uncharacterized protein n=1 Tax=Microbulbifer rhizosphaerae TaxID=1562603 RepID=A0A7W4Z7N3_9GAMM|nr:hypothetical protein [Microbulbifer rhizosphaerae]MBB3059923.1 hypothetical protein [Microbulbifer rhizosphaerae]
MSTWEPIKKSHLEGIIEVSEYEMGPEARLVWEKIKLPEVQKWLQSPMGDEGGGFWVVAIYGNKCLYYNDIEDGFNESSFKEWGTIEEYWCNQTELHHFIASTFVSRS